jgi:anti-anti-sigma factor
MSSRSAYGWLARLGEAASRARAIASVLPAPRLPFLAGVQVPSTAAVNEPSPIGAHKPMQTLVHTDGGVAKIQLRGRFDFGSHREFKTSYEAPLGAAGVSELHIDMGGVEYLDSSALGMLLILKERAGATNKRVAITNCRGAVKQVLDIANFSKLFPIK